MTPAIRGLQTGSDGPLTTVAMVIASAFSAVTILLARVFLLEAIGRTQWFGIDAILAGVMVLSSGR